MQVGDCVLLRIPPARRRKRSVNVREVLNGIFLSLLKNELRPIGWGQAAASPISRGWTIRAEMQPPTRALSGSLEPGGSQVRPLTHLRWIDAFATH
jgi:hypothetical protein